MSFINVKQRSDLDIKYEIFVPGHKEANIFFVRSLINSDLKMPTYMLHDSAYEYWLFMDILTLLEKLGLKIVYICNTLATPNLMFYRIWKAILLILLIVSIMRGVVVVVTVCIIVVMVVVLVVVIVVVVVVVVVVSHTHTPVYHCLTILPPSYNFI